MSDYLSILNEAWAQHLAPREPNAPTVISTFAGGGGSSLGYSMAGFHELLAVEWDDNAVATFNLNFPEVPVYHDDIAKLSVDEVLRRTKLMPGQLDVFDGSPPCQGFSTAGKRMIDDPRNQLFREYVRLLKGLQPKVFVMENVSGMVKGKMKLIFADILRELKSCGYKVKAVLMNAMYFNVPQSRERMIFIGVRDDLGIEPSHPKAQAMPISMGTAWQALPISIVPDECGISQYAIGAEWRKLQPGQKSDKYLSLVKPSLAKPSPTITKGMGMTASLASVTHPTECRKYTIEEAKRIGSFPDFFRFTGEWGNGIERIGNSVPPLFMRAIAAHIRQNILARAEAEGLTVERA